MGSSHNARPRQIPTRSVSQRIHRWLGLGLGAWFLLVGVTGALLVWRDELDAALNPGLFRASPLAAPLDLDALVDSARAAEGLGRVERIRLPPQPGSALRLQFRTGASRVESGRVEVFVDPADGRLLGLRSLEPVSLSPPHLMRTLYEFHRNVLLGEPGSNLVGAAGFLLMTSAITGLVIAWPRTRARLRRLLAVQWDANAARVALDLHRSCGIMIVAVLLLSTATGATLVYLNYVRDLVGRVSRVDPIPVLPFRAHQRDQPLLTLNQMAARVAAAFPALGVTEIQVSERGLSGVLFKLRGAGDVHRQGDTIVWVHPASGEALAERSDRTRSGGEGFMHWLLPLHVGSAFGTPGLVAMCIAGIAPLVLLPTGLWLWWRKRAAERLAREHAGRRG